MVARRGKAPPKPDFPAWWKGIKSLMGCTDPTRSLWDEQVTVAITKAGGGSRVTIFLQWKAHVVYGKFTEPAWRHMQVPEGMRTVFWGRGMLGANIQGSGRSKERT